MRLIVKIVYSSAITDTTYISNHCIDSPSEPLHKPKPVICLQNDFILLPSSLVVTLVKRYAEMTTQPEDMPIVAKTEQAKKMFFDYANFATGNC